jgi:hypothetical protein
MMDDAAQAQFRPQRAGGAPQRSPLEICGMLWVFFWCTVVPLMLLVAGLFFVVYQTVLQEPYYSVAVDSVAGLDPVFGGSPPMLLDPEFNLTFRVASHGFWVRECAEPGIHVDVSYRGVLLASTMTEFAQIQHTQIYSGEDEHTTHGDFRSTHTCAFLCISQLNLQSDYMALYSQTNTT